MLHDYFIDRLVNIEKALFYWKQFWTDGKIMSVMWYWLSSLQKQNSILNVAD